MGDMSILNKVGNKNFTLLAKMLDLANARQRVISQNVANVNTPNYRRRSFDFEKSLRDAMEQGSAQAYSQVRGYVSKPNTTAVRNNGNNVDIDMEMNNLNFNSTSFEVYSTIYNRKSNMLKSAIKGVR